MSSTKTPSTRKAAAAVDIQADEPRRQTRKGKRKGILDWRGGGPAKRRGKFGQVLSNDYLLKLPKSAGKDKKQGPSNVRP